MNKTTIFQLVIIVLLVIILGAIVIAGDDETPAGTDTDNGTSATIENVDLATTVSLGKETLAIGLPPWPGATVKSNVVAAILEQMGYSVELRELDAGVVYTSLADQQLDMTVAGWLPTTHQDYWSEVGGSLDIAGVNVTQTWLGLGVPNFVDESIQSIEDLQGETAFGESVDYRITGIEPGAGVMANTERAIEEYGLSNWTLQQSSSAAMLTALQEAFGNEEPIIATVWRPHSAFAVGDLRTLEDPMGIYNDSEATTQFLQENAPDYADAEVSSDVLASVVYDGLASDAPAAYQFLQNFSVPAETQSQWIYQYSVEERPAEEIAIEYILENTDTVQSWVPQN